MADTSARMLRLLSLLQSHRHWPGPELCDRLGVSERTLRRDVDRLRGLGYQVESVPGAAGGYQLSAGSTLPPMVFDHDEAVALAIGLGNVAVGTDPSTAEASLRALAKLTAMLPAAVRAQIELMSSVTETNPWLRAGPAPAAAVLGTVAQACRDNVRVRFDYNAADQTPSHRYAEPYRLVTLGRRWYLVAYDLDRDNWRTFRVDRISDPSPSRNSFTPRPLPAKDLPAYVNQRIRELRTTIEVTLAFRADVERVKAAVGPWADVTPGPDASTAVVTMATDSLDWAVATIAGVDADFSVIAPPELASLLSRLAGRVSRNNVGAG